MAQLLCMEYHGPLQIATFWEWRSPSTFTTGMASPDLEVYLFLKGNQYIYQPSNLRITWGFRKIVVPNNHGFSMVFLLKMIILGSFGGTTI